MNVILSVSWGFGVEKHSDEDIFFMVKFEKKNIQIGTFKVKLPN